MSLEVMNPATGKVVQNYETIDSDRLKQQIEKTHQAFLEWKKTDFSHRASLMKKAAEVLESHQQEWAELMAQEMGKPVADGKKEIQKCAWVCNYYSENAEKFLQPEEIQSSASKSYVSFQPIGTVLAVMPWNFPFWQVFRFAAPALMAGNAGLLKHASNVPGCGLAIEDVFQQAGFPENLFKMLMIKTRQTNEVLEHPFVRAATLTGSTYAGKAVASKAGEMLKKTVLELGGSDPYVILPDVNIDEVAKTCAASRLINTGQSCIAAKRFIIQESQKEQFEQGMVQHMQSQKIGDPMDENTQLGPMARHDLRDELHEQVKKSIEMGAKCLAGGEVPDDPGAYYPATVLTEVKKGMPAYDDELFGPVAAIITAKDEEEQIRIANDSVFGLGAAVFTQDVEKGTRIAEEELDAGCCFVNDFVKSDPRLPFGGVKESGYGRELSYYGIKEFVNIKTVYIK